MSSDLRKKTAKSVLYKFFERFSAQLITTIVTIFLARILAPSDFGVIVLIMVFINLLNVFVVDGFGNALIQNKNADSLDFSTCFYSSFVLSIFLYFIVYFFAPVISNIYNLEIITVILRVMGIKLIIASYNTVQNAIVAKQMLFKKTFFATLIGSFLSGIIGIYMALRGYGLWAIVGQYMISSIVYTIVLTILVKWRPKKEFSFKRLKKIFNFGWKITATGIINHLYNDLRLLIIGKQYSQSDLAYYSKGRSFPSLIILNINTSILTVMFPVLSNNQENLVKLKSIARRSFKISAFVIFPILVGFAVIADSFVILLLTEKWAESIIYVRLFSLGFLTLPLASIGDNVMRALGRSDLVLKTNILKKLLGIIVILISMFFGVFWIAIGVIIGNVIALIINMFPNKLLIRYEYKEQIYDFFKYLFTSIIMGFFVLLISLLKLNLIYQLPLQIFLGIAIYVFLTKIFKIDQFEYLKKIFIDKNKDTIK